LNKKVLAVAGGIAGIAGLGWLITRALAKPSYPVTLTSNPIRTAILVDDKALVPTPKTITLTRGTHIFKAVPKSPDLLLTYQIDKWVVNGRTVASDTPTLTLNITGPSKIRLDYMLAEAGVNPIVTLPQ
jgi:hypothetical protein